MLGNGSGKLGALRAVGGGLETGPESWERGCEGWRHPWLMLPLHSRILTIPVPPIPIPLTFAFPCTPQTQAGCGCSFGVGRCRRGGQGSPHPLAQSLTSGAPALLPTICSGHPTTKQGSVSGWGKWDNSPMALVGTATAPLPPL